MKSCEEMTNNVFSRRDAYFAKEKRKRAVITRVSTVLSVCLVIGIAGVSLWKTGAFSRGTEPGYVVPGTDTDRSTETEPVTSGEPTDTEKQTDTEDLPHKEPIDVLKPGEIRVENNEAGYTVRTAVLEIGEGERNNSWQYNDRYVMNLTYSSSDVSKTPIVYSNVRLRILDLETGKFSEPYPLADCEVCPYFFSYTPDGCRLLSWYLKDDGTLVCGKGYAVKEKNGVFTVTELSDLAVYPQYSMPVYSPDGSRMAYTKTTDGWGSAAMYIREADGKEKKILDCVVYTPQNPVDIQICRNYIPVAFLDDTHFVFHINGYEWIVGRGIYDTESGKATVYEDGIGVERYGDALIGYETVNYEEHKFYDPDDFAAPVYLGELVYAEHDGFYDVNRFGDVVLSASFDEDRCVDIFRVRDLLSGEKRCEILCGRYPEGNGGYDFYYRENTITVLNTQRQQIPAGKQGSDTGVHTLDALGTLGLPEDDDRLAYIRAFVTGDVEALESLCGVQAGLYDSYRGIRLSDWKAWIEKDEYGHDRLMFSFNPSVSGVDAFSVNTWNEYILSEGLNGVDLVKNGLDNRDDVSGKAAEAVARFTRNYIIQKIPANDDMDDAARFSLTCYISGRLHMLTCYISGRLHIDGTETVTEQDYRDYAELYFGIRDFTPDKGHIEYGCAHGGAWQALTVTGCTENTDGTFTVTVQYYADYAKTVKSHIYQYTVKKVGEEWAFTECRETYHAPYEPYGYAM